MGGGLGWEVTYSSFKSIRICRKQEFLMNTFAADFWSIPLLRKWFLLLLPKQLSLLTFSLCFRLLSGYDRPLLFFSRVPSNLTINNSMCVTSWSNKILSEHVAKFYRDHLALPFIYLFIYLFIYKFWRSYCRRKRTEGNPETISRGRLKVHMRWQEWYNKTD